MSRHLDTEKIKSIRKHAQKDRTSEHPESGAFPSAHGGASEKRSGECKERHSVPHGVGHRILPPGCQHTGNSGEKPGYDKTCYHHFLCIYTCDEAGPCISARCQIVSAEDGMA